MRISIISTTVSLGLMLGINTQANESMSSAHKVSGEVINALDQEGDVRGMNPVEIADARSLVDIAVKVRESSESATQAAFSDKVTAAMKKGAKVLSAAAKKVLAKAKAVLPKIAAAAKKATPKIVAAVKKVGLTIKKAALKTFESIKKYGPKVVATVREVAEALGIKDEDAFAIALTAAINPVTPPGGVQGFFKGVKRDLIATLVGESDTTEEDIDEALLAQKVLHEDDTDGELKGLLDDFIKSDKKGEDDYQEAGLEE